VGDTRLAAFSNIEPQTARVFAGVGRNSGERAFRAAVRHSRHIRLLRIGIPCAVVVTLVVGVAIPAVLKPLRVLSKLPVDIGSVVVSGTKIMMQQPRISGFTRDNHRYDLTAQAAGQDLKNPDMVELQGIHATMEMQDDASVKLTARNGLYNSKTELLTLTSNIVVTSTNGQEALLSEAVLDTRSGTIVSESPVYVKTPTATINANRMEVADNGDLMRFERGVTVMLLPDSETAAALPHYEARSR
jgi:lipopolysaccharide export system protein LptC